VAQLDGCIVLLVTFYINVYARRINALDAMPFGEEFITFNDT